MKQHTTYNLVAYIINSKNIDSKVSKIAVIMNASMQEEKVDIKDSNWGVVVNSEIAGTNIIEEVSTNIVSVPAKSIMVLIKQ